MKEVAGTPQTTDRQVGDSLCSVAHLHVLVVSSQLTLAQALSEALIGQNEYRVSQSITVNDETAIAVIQEERPDAIFLSADPGGLDGYNICRLLKKDARF